MNRRTFLGMAAAGTALARPRGLVLEAESGARLPQTLVVQGIDPAPLFELREYRAAEPASCMEPMLARSGIHPVRRWNKETFAYLIPFDSLAQRADAWTRFNADPEWRRLRSDANLAGVTIYRVKMETS